MALDVTCHAATREDAAAFLEAVGIARWDADTGQWAMIADGMINASDITVLKPTGNIVQDPFGNDVAEMASVPGYHFDLRFTDASYLTLCKPVPEEGWPPDADMQTLTT